MNSFHFHSPSLSLSLFLLRYVKDRPEIFRKLYMISDDFNFVYMLEGNNIQKPVDILVHFALVYSMFCVCM